MSQIKKFDTVFFGTDDMDRAVAFYRDVLGLAVKYESQWWSSFDLGGVQLGIHHGGAPSAGGWIVCLETTDLKGLRETLCNAGAETADEFHDTPRGAILNFKDPDGNSLQAIQLGKSASDLSS